MKKQVITFQEICKRIAAFKFPQIDLVIGIATGGSVPAALMACHLHTSLEIIRVQYRNEENEPIFPSPRVFMVNDPYLLKEKRILLVDDVSVTGKTMEAVKGLISNHNIISTCVLKGQADFVLMPELNTCVKWPWSVSEKLPYQMY